MNSFDSLFKQAEMQLESLANMSSVKEEPLEVILDKHGINRRDFLKWAASITAMLALPAQFTPLVADAVKLADRLPLVWLHLAECTGCSESLIRSDSPTIISPWNTMKH